MKRRRQGGSRGGRRKCMYKNCNHQQGISICKLYVFPQNNIMAGRWLEYAGVEGLTPKRLKPHHYLCSCHFPHGQKAGPTDYDEEYGSDHELDSPAAKRQSAGDIGNIVVLKIVPMDENEVRGSTSITPRTQNAAEALLNLQMQEPAVDQHSSFGSATHFSPVQQSTPMKLRKATPVRFSPRRHLWSLHNKIAEQSPKKTLQRMLDFSGLSSPSEKTICATFHDDLGVSPLRLQSFPPSEPSGMSSVPSTEAEACSAVTDSTDKRSAHSIGIQCERPFLSYGRCRQLPEKIFQFYTGVTQHAFELIYKFIGGDDVCSKLKYEYTRSTPQREQFQGDLYAKDKMFLTLLRLRRGIPFNDLKMLFNIQRGQAGKIFYTWIRFMRLEFKKLERFMFISAAAQPKDKIPKCFRMFDNLRVVIDTCHFKMQKPKHLQQSTNTFSEYKSFNSIKFLVGISCYGGLSFISEGYEGRISDRKIVEDSGFMDHLQAGDAIMGDKGFDIADLADEKGVDLIIPAFMQGRPSLTGRELMLSRAIAESRIHVERFIGKMNEFRLIRYLIPNTLLPIASDIVIVCAFLINFREPFIMWGDDSEIDE